MPGSNFDNELNRVLSECLGGGAKRELNLRLESAKAAAKGVGIYSQEKGFGSYYTIRAALALAMAVWKEEKERRKASQE